MSDSSSLINFWSQGQEIFQILSDSSSRSDFCDDSSIYFFRVEKNELKNDYILISPGNNFSRLNSTMGVPPVFLQSGIYTLTFHKKNVSRENIIKSMNTISYIINDIENSGLVEQVIYRDPYIDDPDMVSLRGFDMIFDLILVQDNY